MTEDKEKTLEFIEDYRYHQVLWDTKYRFYSNKAKRSDAWIAMSKKHNTDVQSVKNKVKSLRSYFSKEHRKVLTQNDYESTWFAYKAIYFIWDSSNPKESSESEENLEYIPNLECTTVEEKSSDHFSCTSETDPTYMQQPIDVNSVNDNGTEEFRLTREYLQDGDECRTFGELVAHKLRKLNPRNRLLAQHQINNMFYDLEMEELDSAMTTPVVDSVCTLVPKLSPPHNLE